MKVALAAVVLVGLLVGLLLAGPRQPPVADPAPVAAPVPAGQPAPTPQANPPPPTEPALEGQPPPPTVLSRSGNGAFRATALVDGQPIDFVIDTGASAVALTQDDARRAGVPFDPARFTEIGQGASGPVRGQAVLLGRIELDGKAANGVRAAVLEGLPVSLLGQSYLRRLDSVQIAGDTMTLR